MVTQAPHVPMPGYLLHGYRLVTDVPLPGHRASTGHDGPAAADVLRIRHLPSRRPAPTASGGLGEHVVADLCDPARRQVYRFTRTDDRLLLRFTGTADVRCDPAMREGEAWSWPGVDPAVLSVLLPGTILATRLILDGRLVLHASAFEADGAAVAVVGPSGTGKSTLGTLAVLAGARLLTDDVLRVDLDGDVPTAWPGGGETRLRASAAGLAERFAAAGTVRTTADQRTAVAMAPAGAADAVPLPLRCCVVPFPRRDVDRVTVRQLDPFRAMQRLAACPRVVGWCDAATSAEQFGLLADLCQRVPVVEAALPWGPPFDAAVIRELVEALPGR